MNDLNVIVVASPPPASKIRFYILLTESH